MALCASRTLTDGQENVDIRGGFDASSSSPTPFHGILLVAREPHLARPKLQPHWDWDPIHSVPVIYRWHASTGCFSYCIAQRYSVESSVDCVLWRCQKSTKSTTSESTESVSFRPRCQHQAAPQHNRVSKRLRPDPTLVAKRLSGSNPGHYTVKKL